jgi:Lhr-like helicase
MVHNPHIFIDRIYLAILKNDADGITFLESGDIVDKVREFKKALDYRNHDLFSFNELIKDNIESAPEAAREQILATLDLEIEKTKIPWKRSLLRVIPKDRKVTKTILMYVFQRGQENLLDRAISKLINETPQSPLTRYAQKIEFLQEHGGVEKLNSVIEEINKEIEADHHHRHLLPL